MEDPDYYVRSMSDESLHFSPAEYDANETITSDPQHTTLKPVLPQANCLHFLFLLNTVVIGTICIFGFFGAILAFVVLQVRLKGIPAVATFLLRALSISDAVFIALWLIQYSFRYLLKYHGVSPHQAWFLYLMASTHPMMFMAQFFTAWTVVIIAINRYLAVCMPYRSVRISTLQNFRWVVIAALVFSVAWNLPRYAEVTIGRNEQGQITYNKTALFFNKIYHVVYTHVFYYMFSFILPLLLLLVLNTRVIIEYRRSRRKHHEIKGRKDSRGSDDDNISVVMIVVVLVFMMCQAPSKLTQSLVFTIPSCQENPIWFYLANLAYAVEALNSSANVILYLIFYPRFRSALCTWFQAQRSDGAPAERASQRPKAKYDELLAPGQGNSPQGGLGRAVLLEELGEDKGDAMALLHIRQRAYSVDECTAISNLGDIELAQEDRAIREDKEGGITTELV